ncbi:MAG: DUF2254 domain-containing protein [Leptolyngbyaceae cyanobacterium RU_5_1]|nr:DUF2254 domain-containing protein [Leptolyngbyaceae cyanobacterium RU_5_1]
MRNVKLGKLWDLLHSSYWFLPTVMAVAAAGLAFLLLAIDSAGSKILSQLTWLYAGGPEGARAVLSAVAGSIITVTATAFSITIVALQLASSNFGPRLLRTFMQDTGNQVVLGTFIGTFIYCLLVLRTIHGEDYQLFVPQLSVTVAIGLAITSVGVLIYFIHHAATIIQVSHVIANVSEDLEQAIDRVFPETLGQSASDQHLVSKIPTDFDAEAHPLNATKTGYLQAIDDQKLMQLADNHRLLLRLQIRPGQFVVKGSELLQVYPRDRITPAFVKHLNDAFLLGHERTEQQDVEFPIDQLVEIALRAISPAVNDPFTAIRCIDRLGAGLAHLATRNFPSPHRYDKTHTLRVIAEPVTFEQLVDAAFNQIRHYGRSDADVTIRLLDAIALVAHHTHHSTQQTVLQRHADMILRGSQEGLAEELDRQALQERYYRATKALKQPQESCKSKSF